MATRDNRDRLSRPPTWNLYRAWTGVPPYQLYEVFQLEKHMLERLRLLAADTSDEMRLSDWLASRFTYPLRSLLIQAKRGAALFLVLNLVVVGGGFATSGIAVASGSGHRGTSAGWTVFALGLFVAVAGGVTQLFRPGHRATQRASLTEQLREEGWAFANRTSSYEVGDRDAFELLDRRVSEIHRRAGALSAIEDLPTSAGAKGRRTSANARNPER